jgi:DNA-binding NarL/FixJ family response regulator
MRILLADDHPLFLEGVKPVLRKLHKHVELIEAFDYPSAFSAMHTAGEVDVALLDLYMPGMAGIEGAIRFRSAFPQVPLVILSASELVEDVQNMLAAGILGYIPKSSSSELILSAIKQVLAGGIYVPHYLHPQNTDEEISLEALQSTKTLSRRQLQVLRELGRGLSNRQIGEILKVTEGTVKIHVSALFRLLKVDGRAELVLLSRKLGMDK